jgi:hypothetical protein
MPKPISLEALQERIHHAECAAPPPPGTEGPLHLFKYEMFCAVLRLSISISDKSEEVKNKVAEIIEGHLRAFLN